MNYRLKVKRGSFSPWIYRETQKKEKLKEFKGNFTNLEVLIMIY